MFENKKFVFVVGAFNAKSAVGNLEEYCKVEVFAKSADEAIKKSKELINKNYYEVSQIIETEKK
jgi:hypothetical protein